MKLGKTVEITVRQSSKVVLIAKLISEVPGGFLFRDEVQNQEFALSNEDVISMEVL